MYLLLLFLLAIQVSDAQTFDTRFLENIEKNRQLRKDVYKKFTDYEKKLHFEQTERHSLESALKKEQGKSKNFEKLSDNLNEQIAAPSKINDSLSKENGEMKKDLKQCEEKIKSLTDDQKLKEIETSNLNQDHQKLLKEKASFNKNFNDRLKVFLNGISNSEANEFVMIEESVQIPIENDRKRSYDVDSIDMSLIHENNPETKRQKIVDPPTNSCDPNNNPTNTQYVVHKTEPVEESQTCLDFQFFDDDHLIANADSTNIGIFFLHVSCLFSRFFYLSMLSS